MNKRLDVYLYGVRVGQLEMLAPQRYELTYRPDWMGDEYAMPISMSLPLQLTPHQGPTLTAFLDNLLPDNAEVRDRWAIDAGLPTTEIFDLLGAYGRDVAGALQFVGEGGDPDAERRRLPANDSTIAARIRAVRDDDTRWHDADNGPGYFSLGGAQGKFALGRTGDGWYDPSGGEPTTHIFKPRVRGQQDGELVEHVTMQTAITLGINAARTQVNTFDDEHSLVVERFDRIESGGDVIRLHQEDLAQAFGVTRLQKYEYRGGPTYRQILGFLADRGAPETRDRSLDSFVKALVFSWMMLNTDAHAKNYSVFITPAGVSLTPLYDVSSLLPFVGRPDDNARSLEEAIQQTKLSMRIAADYEAGQQTWFEWLAVAREAGVDRRALEGWAQDVALLLPLVVETTVAGLPRTLQTDTLGRYVEHTRIRSRQLQELLASRDF